MPLRCTAGHCAHSLFSENTATALHSLVTDSRAALQLLKEAIDKQAHTLEAQARTTEKSFEAQARTTEKSFEAQARTAETHGQAIGELKSYGVFLGGAVLAIFSMFPYRAMAIC